MSEETKVVAPPVEPAYGYSTDEVKQSPFSFGLNVGCTHLTKFEWIPNGGKDGAEAEALEIVFNINGTDKGYRQFPVTKAYDKNNVEVTDPLSQEMKDAFQDFNARIVHILHCFQERDVIQAAFSRPIKNFKEYVNLATSILPKNFKEKTLDIFLQYQWQISEKAKVTYLDIPKKMSYGKWLAPTIEGVKWKEIRATSFDTNTKKALYYVEDKELAEGEEPREHVFIKNGWFMDSNFAKQQREDGGAATGGVTAHAPVGAAAVGEAGKTSTW